MRHIAALTLAAALLAAPASAATYTFSFDGIGDHPGTVSGLIDGLSDDGLGQSANSVVITSVTGSAYDFSDIYGFNFAGPPSNGELGFHDSQQRFDVVGGAIGLGQFAAIDQMIDIFDFSKDSVRLLCFYSSGTGCGGLLSILTGQGLEEVYHLDNDARSVRFARLPDQPSAVPLPATAGLLLSALALTGLFARPRKAT
jgi:hypothetical protein